MPKNNQLTSALYHAQVLKDLHSIYTPHTGQIQVGNALFYQNKKKVMVCCGRKWGKSSLVVYVLYRWLLTTFNGCFYYFTREQKQANEIMWDSGRLPYFLPKELMDRYKIKLDHTDSRIICGITNSFIRVDGSDSYDSYRGVNPNGSVYDEYAQFRPELHKAFGPNHAAHDAPLLVVGTPSMTDDPDDVFNSLEAEVKASTNGAYFNMPTWVNPTIKRSWLIETKKELFRLGREAEWLREFEAIKMKDPQLSIFPMLSRDRHVFPHAQLMEEIKRDRRHIEFVCVADPASKSVFGVLFRAFNRFTKVAYELDEVYATVPAAMTTRAVWNEIERIIDNLGAKLEEFSFCYDEASAWFVNEFYDYMELKQKDIPDDMRISIGWIPTRKSRMDKDEGWNLIRTQLIEGKLKISDRCKKLYWEMDNYKKDSNGRVKKENDHMLDCMRYANELLQVGITEETPPSEVPEHLIDRRAFTIDEDLNRMRQDEDWSGIESMDWGED